MIKKFFFSIVFSTGLLIGSAAAQISIPLGATVSLSNVVSLSCVDLNVQGTLILSDAEILEAKNVLIEKGGLLSAGDSRVSLNGNWSNNGKFIPGSSAVQISDQCGAIPSVISGTTTFHNLVISSSVGKIFLLPDGASIYVSGILSVIGASLGGEFQGAARVILLNGGQLLLSDGEVLDGVEVSEIYDNIHGIPALGSIALTLLFMFMLMLSLKFVRNQRQ